MVEKIVLKYGKEEQELGIAKENFLGALRPKESQKLTEEAGVIKEALENPVGTPPLQDLVKTGEQVAVIISDITRPCPSALILPHVLAKLNQAGIPDKDIVVVSGLGVHRPHTEEERRNLVGEDIFKRVKCIDSFGEQDDFIELGKTSQGTPLQVFRPVVEADKRICIGNIDYHYFAGYSGGAKAIVPGVCTRETIQANHRMMLHPKAKVGIIEGNPVREDLEEITGFLSVDFIVNVVLDEEKNIMAVVAGDYIQAHRIGCQALDQAYRLPIEELADIVITCPHGFPKDINIYQAQKALDNARWAAKPGGIIILVGKCQEGLGEDTFARWIEEAKKPEDLIERISADFQLGGHKAAAIADMATQFQIYLVSDLSPDLSRKLFMEPFSDVNQAFQAALEAKGQEAKTWVMPTGGSTLPHLITREEKNA